MAASHALAMGPALLRRFCRCDFVSPCGCGQEPPRSGWTVAGLTGLRDLYREHRSLTRVAALTSRRQHDCNVALDALLGRTPTHALAVLEAQAAKNLRVPRQLLAVHGTSAEQIGSKGGTEGTPS